MNLHRGAILICCFHFALAQNIKNNPASNHGNKFEQLGFILPTPNSFRNASGAPGHAYWQQRADYIIDVTLDEKERMIKGKERIIYFNQSPDALDYLWLQLDENQHHPDNPYAQIDEIRIPPGYAQENFLEALQLKERLKGYGVQILEVKDAQGNPLPYTIHHTMMRIDLPRPLKPKSTYTFEISWQFRMVDRLTIGGRCGYEFFPEDSNDVYMVTQWYPRMCVYSDFQGWQHKQFTGRGEFALTFGNFTVNITVPSDHAVCATGECMNLPSLLNPTQYQRYLDAKNKESVVEIITLDEAKEKEKRKDALKAPKTWKFVAKNVRDFAFGSSRKFIWDAMAVRLGNRNVMCMSFYPKEAYGLYRKYSTKVVAHTIKTYSKYTIDYPYPVAISCEASSGMEYPMISFNYGRTRKDGTYSEALKNGMIGVIIHEVGHNFFPMIINSDERQWSWMDEGLNTFVQYLTEMEWDENYPNARGPAFKITDYMRLPKEFLEPIMTNSENIIHFGHNAYSKPATALNILRESIMGRKLFDFAFKTYCRRWAFKHPEPADFFRTMEDASGYDLDWFWRGWFYDIEPVDIAIDTVRCYRVEKGERKLEKTDSAFVPGRIPNIHHISLLRNREEGIIPLVEKDTSLRDFYYSYKNYQKIFAGFSTKPVLLPFDSKEPFKYKDGYLYEITFKNKGGLPMPIFIQWIYSDGTMDLEKEHEYVWRKNEHTFVKTYYKKKKVKAIIIDPYRETADIDESNNTWNCNLQPPAFEIYQNIKEEKRFNQEEFNPMKFYQKK
ncbi:MAG: M1 family metallopeptidase [Bacteroidia bacterium]|nr:M1 family metallopeptidase [Bacteroidia bacterium]